MPRVCCTRMYLAPAREDALAAYDRFLGRCQDKYPQACEGLRQDRDEMFAFYDFPAAHWVHLRTTNPIESTFATVRHRTRQTKACGSRVTALTMVFKLATQAERHWRRLNSYQLITHLVDGDTFTDGELQLKKAAWKSATVARIRSLPRPRHAMDKRPSSTTFDNISTYPGIVG